MLEDLKKEIKELKYSQPGSFEGTYGEHQTLKNVSTLINIVDKLIEVINDQNNEINGLKCGRVKLDKKPEFIDRNFGSQVISLEGAGPIPGLVKDLNFEC